jgi:hypothetical protein
MRVNSESLDEQGNVTSTSIREMVTTLVNKNDQQYTVKCETTIEVFGQRFDPDPQTTTRGLWGEPEGQQVGVTKIGDESTVINGQKIPCEVRKIESVGRDGLKRISIVHYSSKVYPFVLKNESKIINGNGESVISEASMEVIALDMPWKVLANLHNSVHCRTVTRNGKKQIVTLDVHCADVPGGLVSQTKSEFDDAGKLSIRSTLELIDYDKQGGTQAKSGFGRRLFPRARAVRSR